MQKRRNNKQKKKWNVRSREQSLIENEINGTFRDIDHDNLENFDCQVGYDFPLRYREWTNSKWSQLPMVTKQAYAYHQRNLKVFEIESKLVSFLLPKRTTIDEIDKSKLKGLPKAFVVDVSRSQNLLCSMVDLEKDNFDFYGSSFPYALNSLLIYFEDQNGNLCNAEDHHRICVIAQYPHDPSVKEYDQDFLLNRYDHHDPRRRYDVAQARLFYTQDAFAIWRAEEHKDTNYDLTTVEEMILSDLDRMCAEGQFSEEDMTNYSPNYIQSVFSYFASGAEKTGLPSDATDLIIDKVITGNPKYLNRIRDLLLTPVFTNNECGADVASSALICRRIATSNLVNAFLKSLTEEQVISSQVRSFHPVMRNKKRNKVKGNPISYSYVTIDSDKLATLKRERKDSVRRSERYQTQVAETMGYRWVREDTPQGLKADEDIFDIVEDTVTGVVKYKVKRPVKAYTRNKHLPPRRNPQSVVSDSDDPKAQITRVKSFK